MIKCSRNSGAKMLSLNMVLEGLRGVANMGADSGRMSDITWSLKDRDQGSSPLEVSTGTMSLGLKGTLKLLSVELNEWIARDNQRIF